jgi:hypothetical protein
MSEICEACDGDKICKDDYHDLVGRMNTFDGENECPSCGQPAGSPGKCAACNGAGELNEEDSDEE